MSVVQQYFWLIYECCDGVIFIALCTHVRERILPNMHCIEHSSCELIDGERLSLFFVVFVVTKLYEVSTDITRDLAVAAGG